MADGFLYEKLVVLNSVYSNTLLPGKTPPQASVIKTQLFPHQTTLVNGMHLYRDKMTRGFLQGNQAINGKLGIIGDPAGTGKTLSILAYMASQNATFPRMTCELSNNSSKYFFSHELYQLSDASSTNLVIVPHSLFNQWKQEIAKHTTMTYVPIETKRYLKDDTIADTIINRNFVLTTNKCYRSVQEYANQHQIQWNNVFIDEASSIYFNSSDPQLKFQFLWFITNNWIPLIFKNPSISKSSLYYIKDRVKIHPDLERWLLDSMALHYDGTLVSSSYLREYLPFLHENRGLTVLRNLSETIKNSINLPSLSNETLQCRPNITLNSLISYYLARNIEPNITSDKLVNLFQALGVEFKDIEDYVLNQSVSKHNLIRRKYQESECVICLDKCEHPTIVSCCHNIYCGKCLLKNTLVNYKCPTCREPLAISNICCLKTLTSEEIILSKNKTEVCLDILNNNKNGKFIIYSSFDNIFYQLFEEIDKLGLKAERIDNGLFSLLKIIKNFNEGKTNVIFVSNIELIRGLSLESISHLIFYHDQPVCELKQVLIHSAQRIGRQKPLKIIHLNSEIQV
jgi:SNF2 family DNA or RNA helicase